MTTNIINILKKQTSALHKEAHELGFFKALLEDRLPVESYVCMLRCLAIINGSLEREINYACNSVLKNLISDYIPKLPLLLKDINYFSDLNIKDCLPAVKIALSVADKIMQLRVSDPLSLIGYLYTLEGSTKGGHILKPHAAKMFNIKDEGKGISFLSVYGKKVDDNWNAFTEKMLNCIDNQNLENRIVKVSKELFENLINIYKHLYPINVTDLGKHVTSINPEAGNHPITTDPDEIAAAIEAAKLCWHEYPYYSFRYGERGLRYSCSDSAWLVTLCLLDKKTIENQVDWFSQLLSSRGMPSIMLETQFKFLHRKLISYKPDNDIYEKIKYAGSYLESKRNSIVSSEEFNYLALNIEKKLPNFFKHRLPGMGKIVLSAVIDKKLGIDNSIESILSFFNDLNNSIISFNSLSEDILKNINI